MDLADGLSNGVLAPAVRFFTVRAAAALKCAEPTRPASERSPCPSNPRRCSNPPRVHSLLPLHSLAQLRAARPTQARASDWVARRDRRSWSCSGSELNQRHADLRLDVITHKVPTAQDLSTEGNHAGSQWVVAVSLLKETAGLCLMFLADVLDANAYGGAIRLRRRGFLDEHLVRHDRGCDRGAGNRPGELADIQPHAPRIAPARNSERVSCGPSPDRVERSTERTPAIGCKRKVPDMPACGAARMRRVRPGGSR